MNTNATLALCDLIADMYDTLALCERIANDLECGNEDTLVFYCWEGI